MAALPDKMRDTWINEEAVLLALRENLEPIVGNFNERLSRLVAIE